MKKEDEMLLDLTKDNLSLTDNELNEKINEAQMVLDNLILIKKVREKNKTKEEYIGKYYVDNEYFDKTYIKVLNYGEYEGHNQYFCLTFTISNFDFYNVIDFSTDIYDQLSDFKEITKDKFDEEFELAINKVKANYNSEVTYENFKKGDD